MEKDDSHHTIFCFCEPNYILKCFLCEINNKKEENQIKKNTLEIISDFDVRIKMIEEKKNYDENIDFIKNNLRTMYKSMNDISSLINKNNEKCKIYSGKNLDIDIVNKNSAFQNKTNLSSSNSNSDKLKSLKDLNNLNNRNNNNNKSNTKSKSKDIFIKNCVSNKVVNSNIQNKALNNFSFKNLHDLNKSKSRPKTKVKKQQISDNCNEGLISNRSFKSNKTSNKSRILNPTHSVKSFKLTYSSKNVIKKEFNGALSSVNKYDKNINTMKRTKTSIISKSMKYNLNKLNISDFIDVDDNVLTNEFLRDEFKLKNYFNIDLNNNLNNNKNNNVNDNLHINLDNVKNIENNLNLIHIENGEKKSGFNNGKEALLILIQKTEFQMYNQYSFNELCLLSKKINIEIKKKFLNCQEKRLDFITSFIDYIKFYEENYSFKLDYSKIDNESLNISEFITSKVDICDCSHMSTNSNYKELNSSFSSNLNEKFNKSQLKIGSNEKIQKALLLLTKDKMKMIFENNQHNNNETKEIYQVLHLIFVMFNLCECKKNYNLECLKTTMKSFKYDFKELLIKKDIISLKFEQKYHKFYSEILIIIEIIYDIKLKFSPKYFIKKCETTGVMLVIIQEILNNLGINCKLITNFSLFKNENKEINDNKISSLEVSSVRKTSNLLMFLYKRTMENIMKLNNFIKIKN